MAKGGNKKTQVEIVFKGRDEFSKITDKMNDDLERSTVLVGRIGANTAELVTGLNSAVELAGAFGSAVAGAMDLMKEAAADQAVNAAFARRFENATDAVNKLREATAGMVSDADLRKLASDFDRANVSLEDTAKVLNVAAKISVETGQDMAEVSESLRDSIIGASDSDLEKFGIVFDLPAAVQDFAKETGLAADEIDKAVESQVVLKHITSEVAGEFADVELNKNLFAQMTQLEARWQNLKDEGIVAFQQIAVGAAMSFGIIDEEATNTLGAIQAGRESLVVAIEEAAFSRGREGLEKLAEDARWLRDRLDSTGQSVDELDRSVQAFVAFPELIEQAKESNEAFARLDDLLLEAAKRRMPEFRDATRDTIIWNTKLRDLMRDLHQELSGDGARAVNFYSGVLESQLQTQLNAAKGSAEGLADGLQGVIDKVIDLGSRAVGPVVEAMGDEELQAKGKSIRERKEAERRAAARRAAAARKRAIERKTAGFTGPVPLATEGFTGPPADMFFMGAEGFGGVGASVEQAGPPIQVFNERINEARENVDALSNSFGALSGSFGDEFIEGLRMAGETAFTEIGRVRQIFEQAELAGLGSGEAVKKAAPGTIKAFGAIAGALGASVETQETILGFADVAASATHFAAQDYVGGAAYAVSAGLHFAAAGVAASGGKGGGARGSAGRGRNIAPPPPQDSALAQTPPVKMTQIYGGVTMVGPGGVREASRALTAMVDDEHQQGSHSPDFQFAG